MAFLYEVGKVPSDKARLMMLVIGRSKESRQDLSRKVGIMSREQVELEDNKIACLTSLILAGAKVGKDGGGEEGGR